MSRPVIVQSIMFDKHRNTLPQAYAWLKKHGYKIKKIDETNNYYRFRQISPSEIDKKNSPYLTHYVNKLVDEHKIIYLVLAYKG